MPDINTLLAIHDDTEETFQQACRNALRRNGWELTCDWPDALLFWSKTLPDGRIIVCIEKTAIAIQSALERMKESANA
jgi:hypothetical protein